MTNVYVIGCRTSKEAAIIDAGGEGPKLVALAEDQGFKITPNAPRLGSPSSRPFFSVQALGLSLENTIFPRELSKVLNG